MDPYQFDRILEQMRASLTNEGFIRLNFVSGFYSDWSPSIRTSEIKILADLKDQKIEISEDCTISPPILGYVGTFEMTLKNRKDFEQREKEAEAQKVPKTEENQLKIEKNTDIKTVTEKRENLRLEKRVERLQTPLWLIFALLLFHFLFK